ncbi:hypothetical protein BB560_004704 [Smittium megazygosporum]|uniref:SURF4-domain-containing protein n=1 Tax=Smittium megazygosporum TaxID=133381 RepID=A0A2T9Z8H3_9FUNG|nr:hypothetical protein BB560_004704 [Smittium megazygosporum]
MDKLRVLSERFETYIASNYRFIKPYVPPIARGLLVSTFIEDAIRIVIQWSSQMYYLTNYRHFPSFLSFVFLAYNVIVMFACSYLAITRRHSEIAVGGLLTVVVGQGFAYGLIFEFSFFMRNLSVIGGLLILMAESYIAKRKNMFAGLPSMSEEDRSSGEMNLFRILVVIIGGLSCLLVAVGFKARYSAMRDFVKYDFFQTLSIVGGFLLLVDIGPGSFSVDEKKKDY